MNQRSCENNIFRVKKVKRNKIVTDCNSEINISVISSFNDNHHITQNNKEVSMCEDPINNRLSTTKAKRYRSLLGGTPLSQKMSQTHYHNFEFRNKYYKEQGYKKGEFFANLMVHLNNSPMNASNSIKPPCVRINMSILRPLYWQQLKEDRSKQVSKILSRKS